MGKTALETLSDFTFNPGNIFGFDKSAQRDLDEKLGASRTKQESALADLRDYIENTTQENKGLWDQYGSGLGDYESQLAAALSGQKGAYSQLASALDSSNYKSVAGALDGDPTLAAHDPQSRLNEQLNLSKIGKLTDTKETAEEQLMRMTARREMESQLKAERDSNAASLKARGVYGGGAELAQALAGQQESASRRSMEDVAANANASKRAMSALGQYQQGAASMSSADDALSKFNSSLLQQNKQAVASGRAADNTATTQRAVALNQGATNANVLQAQNADKVRSDERATVSGKTNVNNNSADQVSGITQMQNQSEATKQAQAIAEQRSGGLFDNLLPIF